MDPEKKSLNFIFPTKYVIPKSLKFGHWLSELWFQTETPLEDANRTTHTHISESPPRSFDWIAAKWPKNLANSKVSGVAGRPGKLGPKVKFAINGRKWDPKKMAENTWVTVVI